MKIKQNREFERNLIQRGILVFWLLFWGLNFVDKVIPRSTFLWVGKDRFAQISNYFESIGLYADVFTHVSLWIITVLELLASVLILLSLVKHLKKDFVVARFFFFWGSFVGLVIFSAFSIGDQVFGDRYELLEHSIFWVNIIISWAVYEYLPREDVLG